MTFALTLALSLFIHFCRLFNRSALPRVTVALHERTVQCSAPTQATETASSADQSPAEVTASFTCLLPVNLLFRYCNVCMFVCILVRVEAYSDVLVTSE